MDTESALSFAAAAPFVFLAMMMITNFIPFDISTQWNPLISFVLTTAWGLVLWANGYWEGDVAVFIVADITVTYAVIGLRSQAAHAGIPVSKLSGQEPPTAR